MSVQPASPPRCLRGFESIHRYWDGRQDRYAAKIKPGEYYVTQADEIVVTVLGSCVAACMRDPVALVGGMNHFMLPTARATLPSAEEVVTSDATRYGNYAMEHLINDILKCGGQKQRLEVKIFGGGGS